LTATSGAGMQHHGSYINILLQFFFSNEPSSKIYARNAVSGTLFTVINVEKRQFGKTVDVEINNVLYIYMELYLGAKMSDGKYRKSWVAGSVDRENTVLSICFTMTSLIFRFLLLDQTKHLLALLGCHIHIVHLFLQSSLLPHKE
jgi:hypothetical protein